MLFGWQCYYCYYHRIVFIEKGGLVVTRCYLAGNATTATTHRKLAEMKELEENG
jgi:hypothetical protein